MLLNPASPLGGGGKKSRVESKSLFRCTVSVSSMSPLTRSCSNLKPSGTGPCPQQGP